jgi:ketosteroid isomerase-like protein
MKLAAGLIALPVAVLLVSCHPAPLSQPVSDDADARVVLKFLSAYANRDLEGMMRHLAEDAVFARSGSALTKPQIREFFQGSFRKHPNLRVEVGSVKVVQGVVHASVKVETTAIWTDTWLFEMKNHQIHRYSLASGKR